MKAVPRHRAPRPPSQSQEADLAQTLIGPAIFRGRATAYEPP